MFADTGHVVCISLLSCESAPLPSHRRTRTCIVLSGWHRFRPGGQVGYPGSGPDDAAALLRGPACRGGRADITGVPVDLAPIDVAFIAVPVLVVSWMHDLADFRQIAVSLADIIPRVRHVELPWAGHLPSLERPAEITALLLDFLASAAPPRLAPPA